jgi:3-hydroxyisobutyrate dehydrogenase-like beta-hydroxyacid dehydrogenase
VTTVGFLHPGAMGATLAATAVGADERLWAGAGRSAQTAARAAAAGLVDVGDIGELCHRCDLVVSICPPASALDVARQVAETGFEGRYLDANAISPDTSTTIGSLFGDRYLDGGVIGPPAQRAGTTRLYLAGVGAAEIRGLWAGSALDVRALSETADGAGASALKMAYAGWTKGSSALLLTVNALAREAGVLEALREEWDLSQPGLAERSARAAAGSGPKAWRWEGEMAEIAATMAAVGLPADFHRGAEELYRRMAGFKDGPAPTLDDVIDAIGRSGR